MNQIVNEVKAAERICHGVQTLRNWRHLGKGPAYLKIGRSVRYKVEDLENFINSKRVDPEKST